MGSKKDILSKHFKNRGKSENPLKIYDLPPRNMILLPFDLNFESIERKLVIDFDKDPIYFKIELQIFTILDRKYPVVIMYRKDNMMDIYYTNEIIVENRKVRFESSLANISFNQLEVIEYKFEFNEMGLDAYFFFKDKLEKDIEFRIKENTPGRELTSILAPIGVTKKKPQYFPIVFFDKFGWIIEENTQIFIKIHGFLRDPIEKGVQKNRMNVYQAYFTLNPIICNWNNNYSGNINPIIINPQILNISYRNISIELIENTDFYEIRNIYGNDVKGHTIQFEFSPAIPNLLSLRENLNIKGRFSCMINKQEMIIYGKYLINRVGDTIEFTIKPTKGLQSFPGKLWLIAYKWTSEIQIINLDDIRINSYWQRVKI